MYFNSSVARYYSREELNTTNPKNHLLKSSAGKDFLQGSFPLYVWKLSCYDSLKIKYAKLQAELSFACAQRPFYSHSSKTSFWISLPTPKRGKPANNSKYNMRRQMLQKSVWREATMLRSAEVDALLNQTVLVPWSVWNKMPRESNQRKTSSFQWASSLRAYGIHFISENNPIQLEQSNFKHKVESAATRAPRVIVIFVNQFLGTNPWRPVFSKSPTNGMTILIEVRFTRKHLRKKPCISF